MQIDANDPATLRQLVAKIDDIDRAGCTDDLRSEIADALRGRPSTDLDTATPAERIRINQLADLTHELMCAPLAACRNAATAHVIETRSEIAAKIITDHSSAVSLSSSKPYTPESSHRSRGNAVVRTFRIAGRS